MSATLGERVRQALGSRSPESVARESGMRAQTIRRLLDGAVKTAPRLDTIEELARATERDPAWLAGWGDGERE